MKRIIVALAITLAAMFGVGVAQQQHADAAPLNCNVLVFKPTHFWRAGNWIPEKVPHGWSLQRWYNACRNRFNPKKRGPSAPQGTWRVDIELNPRNCTYSANQDVKDWFWWVMSDLVAS